MKNGFIKQSGQGMLEMIAAIGLLLLIASAVLGMAVSNVRGQKSSEFYVIGTNLAREAIEVVRNIRDSNWLAGQHWNTGINAGEAIVKFSLDDLGDSTWGLVYSPSGDQKNIYQSVTGLYSHNNEGDQTVFSRSINIELICYDGLLEEQVRSSCLAGENQIGIKVSSLVTWIERGAAREVLIEDLLYDWK